MLRARLRRLCLFACLAFAGLAQTRTDDSAMNEGAYGPEPRGGTASTESIIRMESVMVGTNPGAISGD